MEPMRFQKATDLAEQGKQASRSGNGGNVIVRLGSLDDESGRGAVSALFE